MLRTVSILSGNLKFKDMMASKTGFLGDGGVGNIGATVAEPFTRLPVAVQIEFYLRRAGRVVGIHTPASTNTLIVDFENATYGFGRRLMRGRVGAGRALEFDQTALGGVDDAGVDLHSFTIQGVGRKLEEEVKSPILARAV